VRRDSILAVTYHYAAFIKRHFTLKGRDRMQWIFIFVSFLSIPAIADELHVFTNGEVADADKINENFEILRASGGGCSAQQDGNNVIISCLDGTTGVLASEGTVVTFVSPPEGFGPIISEINTGDILIKDGADQTLGHLESIQEQDDIGAVKLRALIDVQGLNRQTIVDFINDRDTETVSWESTTSGVTLSFQSDDCSGDPLSQNNTNAFVPFRDGYITFGPIEHVGRYVVNSYIWTNRPDDCRLNTFVWDVASPIFDFVPSEYWDQAVYPVRYVQE
jgi:hypothetical protein